MRRRDERLAEQAKHKAKGELLYDKRAGLQPIKRYRPEHFQFPGNLTATCPADRTLTSNGSIYTHTSGAKVQQFKARDEDCQGCELRHRCLKNPASGKGRNVSLFGRALLDDNDPSQKMRRAIDSPHGCRLYRRRIATVEPVFANIRHHKRLSHLRVAWQGQGAHPVAAVLPGAQHREDRDPGDATGLRPARRAFRPSSAPH